MDILFFVIWCEGMQIAESIDEDYFKKPRSNYIIKRPYYTL